MDSSISRGTGSYATSVRKADHRDTELLSILVEEINDDQEKLTTEQAAVVLDVYAYFNVTCDRLKLVVSDNAEEELRAELNKEDASLEVIATLAEKMGTLPVDLITTLGKVKIDRSACNIARLVTVVGSRIDDAWLSELHNALVEESSGRDKSWSPPMVSLLPPLIPGPELPREFTQWAESPTLAELPSDTPDTDAAEEQVESIIFAESEDNSVEEEDKGGREQQLIAYLMRRRSGADRVKKMNMEDIVNRDHIAKLGYWGFKAAITVPTKEKSSSILDMSLQLISASVGGLENHQLIEIATGVRGVLPAQLRAQLKAEIKRRQSFLTQEQKVVLNELVKQ